MFKSKQQLISSADFDNAMFIGINVAVWQEGSILDYGGKIEKHTEHCVWIQDGYYLKDMCKFTVR